MQYENIWIYNIKKATSVFLLCAKTFSTEILIIHNEFLEFEHDLDLTQFTEIDSVFQVSCFMRLCSMRLIKTVMKNIETSVEYCEIKHDNQKYHLFDEINI